MKKRLKWLLVGSLMCVGVGSVFQSSYGMFNDEEIIDEISWEQKALESGISDVEIKKVKKEIFTYQQIVNGYAYWNKFNLIKDLIGVANEKKLNRLINAAEDGCEKAIEYLFINAHLYGWYELNRNDPKGLKLAEKYAEKGSEVAIRYLLSERYGLEANNPEGLVLLEKYAEKGSEAAHSFLDKN